MTRILLAATLSLVALSSQAIGNYYVNVGVGAVFPSQDSSTRANSSSVTYSPTSIGTSVFTLPNVHWENDYETGLEANGAIGFYITHHWRAEGEFIYQNMNREISGTYNWKEDHLSGAPFAFQNNNALADATSTVNVYSLMANILYDFKNSTKWTPTAGVGIGVAWMDSDSTSEYDILSINSNLPPLDETSPSLDNSPALSGAAFAWQLKLGIDYALQKRMTIGINYRLFGTTSFESSSSDIITNPDIDGAQAVFHVKGNDIRGLLNNTVFVGWRYKF